MDRGVLSRSRKPLALLALLGGAFSAVAYALPRTGGTAFDAAVANWLYNWSTDSGAIVFTWISWFDDTALSGLLLAAIILLAHRKRYLAAATVAIATLGAMMINPVLK